MNGGGIDQRAGGGRLAGGAAPPHSAEPQTREARRPSRTEALKLSYGATVAPSIGHGRKSDAATDAAGDGSALSERQAPV